MKRGTKTQKQASAKKVRVVRSMVAAIVECKKCVYLYRGTYDERSLVRSYVALSADTVEPGNEMNIQGARSLIVATISTYPAVYAPQQQIHTGRRKIGNALPGLNAPAYLMCSPRQL